MNAKNLLTPRKKSPFKMDRNSDRYRKCPNDGVEFMAIHRASIFCNDKCADEFHNQKKKEDENKLLEEANAILLCATVNEQLIQSNLPIDKAMQNVNIIEALAIDSVKGSVFNVDYLYSIGVDLSAYNGRGVLHNIDNSLNCHFLQIGSYRLFRVEFSEVLIKKII